MQSSVESKNDKIMYANVAQLARRVKMSCLWQVSSQSGEQFAIATGKSSVDAQKQYSFYKKW